MKLNLILAIAVLISPYSFANVIYQYKDEGATVLTNKKVVRDSNPDYSKLKPLYIFENEDKSGAFHFKEDDVVKVGDTYIFNEDSSDAKMLSLTNKNAKFVRISTIEEQKKAIEKRNNMVLVKEIKMEYQPQKAVEFKRTLIPKEVAIKINYKYINKSGKVFDQDTFEHDMKYMDYKECNQNLNNVIGKYKSQVSKSFYVKSEMIKVNVTGRCGKREEL